MSENQELVIIDNLNKSVMEFKTIEEGLKLVDKAEILRIMAKKAKVGLQKQNEFAEIKLRTERKLGEMLEGIEKDTNFKGNQYTNNVVIPDDRETPTYKQILEKIRKEDEELKTVYNKAADWQRIAKFDDEMFEGYIKEVKDTEKELTQSGLIKVIKKVFTEEDNKDVPDWIRYLDVWNFKENTGDGLSNLPPEIIKNLLHYYTEEGDLVVDPFSGSGLTHKVCQDMNRDSYSSDIEPKEDFINKWDVSDGFPKVGKKAKLIFLDPPYWNMVNYGDECWSNLTYEAFLKRFEAFLKDSKGKLLDEGIIALIVMPLKIEGVYYDIGFDLTNIMHKVGFVTEQRLCVPLFRNWALDPRVFKAKTEGNILTSSLRDLIIYKKL